MCVCVCVCVCMCAQVVVMACREVEMGKNKCERYWPQIKQSLEIGAITVTTVSEGGAPLGLDSL